MNSISIKTVGLIRSMNEKANGQRKWEKKWKQNNLLYLRN